MNPDRPLVSVIVCVYNAGGYLRASVESVLAQTYSRIEVLIIDDGSTDGCMDSIANLSDPRIRRFHQANAGKPAALNVGLSQARGAFYAIHDADDLSDGRRIERQADYLLAHPQVGGVFCGHDLIIRDRRLAPYAGGKSAAQCRADIASFRMPAHDPTGMYRMSMVSNLRYDESLPIVEGYDYILRVGEQFPLAVLGECLYSYRIHPESVTKRDPARRDRLVVELMRRACVRRGLEPRQAIPHVFGEGVSWVPSSDNNLAAHFIESACELRSNRRRLAALRVGLSCAALRPTAPHHWKALAYALLPELAVRRIRSRRMTPVPADVIPALQHP